MYCIYRITNKINGKTYIGQHKYKKLNDSYMGSGKILKQSIKKYGIENFEKEILYSRIQYKATADDMEKFAIAKERAIGKAEYNIADGGQGGNLTYAWNKGKKMSDEQRKKLSEAHKGKTPWNKGKHCSEETKNKISEANTGRHHTDEVKIKMSKQRKGKKHSEEWVRKISKANKGRHNTEETKKKISEKLKGENSPNYGKRLSDETKRKISEANKGRPSPRKGKHWKLIDGKRVWY